MASISNAELIGAKTQSNNVKATDTILITSSMEQPVIPTQAQLIHHGKHQMLPLVYIQTPSKISTAKTNTNNVILNTMPPIQLQNIAPNINVSLTSTNVATQNLFLGKQPIVLQKSQNLQTIPVTPKNGVTYLTMLKPVGKPAETNLITSNRLPISAINKIKSDSIHMVATSNVNTTIPQKLVITPMPKVTSNRLPVTATTNTVQSKIAFMPITIPDTSKHKVYNFKIADGQIRHTESMMVETTRTDESEKGEENLLCNEMIDIESPEKQEEKTYQISILEDSNSRNDTGYTISINEDEKNKFDQRKFPKHGVSILKKSFSFYRKDNPKSIQNDFKSITTISDTDTKEVKITSEHNEETQVVSLPPPPIQKKKCERRRKSTICLRKDYDDFTKEEEQIIITKVKSVDEVRVEEEDEEEQKSDGSLVIDTGDTPEIKLEKFDEECDVIKMLNWDDGIGTLPCSDLKFQINEFGYLEYITKDEFRKISYKKTLKVKEEKKKEPQEEMRCLECGCFGMPSEFITPKYCSIDCQNAGEKESGNSTVNKKIQKKKKQKGYKKKLENGDRHESSEEENTSNENSQDKFSYPWTCQKKGFSWSKYLDHIKAKAAPIKLFKDPFPYNRNGFRPGMKLEGIDPMHPSYFCVLSVNEVLGYRLRLHFDGYADNYDFWVNADSMDIFPAGFCEKFGHTLQPPPTYKEDFNWNFYLKFTRFPAAPKHFFANRNGNAIYPNGFRIGMKLEAVDRKNTSLVCVASIRDMMDNRILVHFDSWDDIYDYWADPTSPYIHPVGWCDQNGHNLTPPNDYPDPESFTWERYLKETKSVAAPVRAFKMRPASGFRKGMRLECVDKRVPQLIRVATVDEVKDHQLRISFDGWPDRYSYWVDDDSPEIHPVGWCQKTGHPIEPPLTPDDVYDFLECATVGCRGQGHIKGPIFPTHSNQKYCPYAEENIDLEKVLPDRLLPPDKQLEAVVPVSREPKEKIKPRVGRPPKYPRVIEPQIKREWPEEVEEPVENLPVKRKIKVQSPPSPPEIKKEPVFLEDINKEEIKMRRDHSKFLNEFVKCDMDPKNWTFEDVVDFVNSLPCCRNVSGLFKKNKIDGESFLMLTQQDIVEILNFKLGPAITLYNCILMLRKSVIDCT